jgi:hypothetical protein
MKRKRSWLPTATYFDEMLYGTGKQKRSSLGMLSFLKENWRAVTYFLQSSERINIIVAWMKTIYTPL